MFKDSVSCLFKDFILIIYIPCFYCLVSESSDTGTCYFPLFIVVENALIIFMIIYNVFCDCAALI